MTVEGSAALRLLSNAQASSELELPLSLSAEEERLLHRGLRDPLFLQGRAGTGKTTLLLHIAFNHLQCRFDLLRDEWRDGISGSGTNCNGELALMDRKSEKVTAIVQQRLPLVVLCTASPVLARRKEILNSESAESNSVRSCLAVFLLMMAQLQLELYSARLSARLSL